MDVKKEQFCRRELTELLRKALDNEHVQADFTADDDGKEYVTVSYDGEYVLSKTNVTGDNLKMIALVTLKGL